MSQLDYLDFLRTKIKLAHAGGFECEQSEINPMLKPHQRDIVQWAVQGGNRAIFAAFGLGKTFMQIETLRIIQARTDGNVLVVVPLGVRQEFRRDGEKLGVSFKFIRTPAEMDGEHRFYLTNYESIRDGKLDPSIFTAVSLDEASVLRSYGSKTYQEFLPLFNGVKYKFVATATPSPNRYKELIHYAGFLGIMDTGQALTRFFQRDSTQANNLTLYPHKEREFWLWLHSWAIFVQRPSDLGYSDDGYDLPPLNVIYHEVNSDHSLAGFERDGQGLIFKDSAIGLSAAAAEKRDSMPARIDAIQQILYNIDSLNLSGGKNGRCKGQKGGLLQSVVREEQGCGTGKTEGEGKEELSRKSTGVQGSFGEVESKEPGEDERTSEGIFGEEQGKNNREKPCLVRGEQGFGSNSEQIQEGKELRTDGSSILGNAESAEQCLCDLRDGHTVIECREFSDRSLPRNGDGQRSALHEMQCGTGNVRGQHGNDIESCGIPEQEQVVIWCNLNDEQEAIEKMLKSIGVSFVSLYGNQDPDEREVQLLRWLNKEATVFLSKTEMYGSGVNMQQAHIMIFAGVDYKFNSFIQGIHRIFRFLQTHECEIHIIHSEAEREILRVLQGKWAKHNEMVKNMSEVIREHGLNGLSMQDVLARTIGVERIQVDGDRFSVANNDCVIEARRQPDNHVGLIVTSIPFANHYEYTPSYNDFGHTESNKQFWEQMDYLTPELLRILKPGRLYCCHVKDRILFGNVTGQGVPTVSPFHAEALFHGIKHGFQYLGMITVVTDVVRENNQTYRLGWSEQCKDGTKMGVGSPEYVLLFRKPQTDRTRGYADEPVKKEKSKYTRARWQTDAHAFWRSSGNRQLTAEEMASYGPGKLAKAFTDYTLANIYSHDFHVKIGEELDRMSALPSTFMSLAPGSFDETTWHDINRMLTLNGAQSQKNLQQHLCPLQFDIVDRLIERYSNPDDLVYDPFCGLGTVPYRAIMQGRRGQGSELNTAYFFDSLGYLKAAEQEWSMPSLFDFEEMKEAA